MHSKTTTKNVECIRLLNIFEIVVNKQLMRTTTVTGDAAFWVSGREGGVLFLITFGWQKQSCEK